MDDLVKQALAKWPNVPHCYDWLGLDARGHWYLRDDAAQAQGSFTSGIEGAKGSLLTHDKLIAFIHRNYLCDASGQWFFQNGPQRVYVELQATPYIWRVSGDFLVTAHTGVTTRVQRCFVDDLGRVYLETELGFGLVHSLDVPLVAQAVEQGLWVPQDVSAKDLPARFGYLRSPAKNHQLLQKK